MELLEMAAGKFEAETLTTGLAILQAFNPQAKGLDINPFVLNVPTVEDKQARRENIRANIEALARSRNGNGRGR